MDKEQYQVEFSLSCTLPECFKIRNVLQLTINSNKVKRYMSKPCIPFISIENYFCGFENAVFVLPVTTMEI